MVTDRYQHVRYHRDLASCADWCRGRVAADGRHRQPARLACRWSDRLPRACVLLFGQEGPGLSEAARGRELRLLRSRSSARPARSTPAPRPPIAMHTWVRQHVLATLGHDVDARWKRSTAVDADRRACATTTSRCAVRCDPPQPGWQVELARSTTAPCCGSCSPPEHEWGCFVIWSDLDESNADGVIAEQVDFFRGLGRQFEWKWYGYDKPGDLRLRLEKAGFVAGRGRVARRRRGRRGRATLCAGATVADGVTLRHVRHRRLDADFAGIVALNQKVWGDGPQLADGRAARRSSATRPTTCGSMSPRSRGRDRLRGVGPVPRGHRLRQPVGRHRRCPSGGARASTRTGRRAGPCRPRTAASAICRSTRRRTAGRSWSGSGSPCSTGTTPYTWSP